MKKGFTLIEVLVALAIVAVLATVATISYQYILANAKRKVCETNLMMLRNATEFYLIEKEALPATLGDLKLDHLKDAFAKAMKDWWTKLSYFIVKYDASKGAYAQFLTYENLRNYGGADSECPYDHNGSPSYGINSSLANKKWSEINDYDFIIAESDSYVFSGSSDIALRHSGRALAITKNKAIVDISSAIAGFPSNLNEITQYFNNMVNNNLGTPIADKAEDVRNKLLTALTELAKTPPDIAAAQGIIDGSRADLQAMIDNGLINYDDGVRLMNLLAQISATL